MFSLACLQVVQLQELFEVRHSVFIVGNAGTGKSMVWKSLFRANQNMKKKPVATDLNPKAVTNDELFGIINPATREWKDGEHCSPQSDPKANATGETGHDDVFQLVILAQFLCDQSQRAVHKFDRSVLGDHARPGVHDGRQPALDRARRRHRPHVDRVPQHRTCLVRSVTGTRNAQNC